jgi:hypothetical protein
VTRRGRMRKRYRLTYGEEPWFGREAPGLLLPPAPDGGSISGTYPRLLAAGAADFADDWVPPCAGDDAWPWRSPSPAPDGFMAPVAPATGPLPANATGWVLASGGHAMRLFPRAMEIAARSGPLATAGPVIGSLVFDTPDFTSVAALALGPFLMGLGLVKLCASAFLARQHKRAKATPHLGDLPPGTRVRIKGIIPEQPTFASLFRGRPGVLARSRIGLAEETRGIDFWIEAPEGERVRILVRDAFLLNRPTLLRDLPICDPVACDWWSHPFPRLRPHLPDAQPLVHRLIPPRLYENSIGLGDFIEVCGVLERAAGPEGEAGPGRGTPLYWTLRGTPESPLLVRRLPDR